jgi:DNA-binding NtrC family response regulator
MLGPSQIRVHAAQTLEMADFLLLATGATVFVLDTHFPGGEWCDAMAMAQRCHPQVAMVICAGEEDRGSLRAAREPGALEVLWRPLEIEHLRAAIRTAHEVAFERMEAMPRLARR